MVNGMSDYLIDVQNLSKVYGEDDAMVYALNDLSAYVQRSEFVAITMDDEIELERALICGINSLESYLSRLQINQTLNHVWDEEAVYQKQESYCVQQRKNDKTLNVLSRMIGEEQANYYMNHVLFPNPKE